EVDVRRAQDARLAVHFLVGGVHLGHVPERFHHGEADQVGEGDLPAAGPLQVVVQDDPVVHQELGRDRAHTGGGGDLQRGLHVLHHAAGRALQPFGLTFTTGAARPAAGDRLGVGGGGGDGGSLGRLGRKIDRHVRRGRCGVAVLGGGGPGGLRTGGGGFLLRLRGRGGLAGLGGRCRGLLRLRRTCRRGLRRLCRSRCLGGAIGALARDIRGTVGLEELPP